MDDFREERVRAAAVLEKSIRTFTVIDPISIGDAQKKVFDDAVQLVEAALKRRGVDWKFSESTGDTFLASDASPGRLHDFYHSRIKIRIIVSMPEPLLIIINECFYAERRLFKRQTDNNNAIQTLAWKIYAFAE